MPYYSFLIPELALDRTNVIVSVVRSKSQHAFLVTEKLSKTGKPLRKKYHLIAAGQQESFKLFALLGKAKVIIPEEEIFKPEREEQAKFRALGWRISAEYLTRLTDSIDSDRKKELSYELMEKNCLFWCIEKLKTVDIEIEKRQLQSANTDNFIDGLMDPLRKINLQEVAYNRCYLIVEALNCGRFLEALRLYHSYDHTVKPIFSFVRDIAYNKIFNEINETKSIPTSEVVYLHCFFAAIYLSSGIELMKSKNFVDNLLKVSCCYLLSTPLQSYLYDSGMGSMIPITPSRIIRLITFWRLYRHYVKYTLLCNSFNHAILLNGMRALPSDFKEGKNLHDYKILLSSLKSRVNRDTRLYYTFIFLPMTTLILTIFSYFFPFLTMEKGCVFFYLLQVFFINEDNNAFIFLLKPRDFYISILISLQVYLVNCMIPFLTDIPFLNDVIKIFLVTSVLNSIGISSPLYPAYNPLKEEIFLDNKIVYRTTILSFTLVEKEVKKRREMGFFEKIEKGIVNSISNTNENKEEKSFFQKISSEIKSIFNSKNALVHLSQEEKRAYSIDPRRFVRSMVDAKTDAEAEKRIASSIKTYANEERGAQIIEKIESIWDTIRLKKVTSREEKHDSFVHVSRTINLIKFCFIFLFAIFDKFESGIIKVISFFYQKAMNYSFHDQKDNLPVHGNSLTTDRVREAKLSTSKVSLIGSRGSSLSALSSISSLAEEEIRLIL